MNNNKLKIFSGAIASVFAANAFAYDRAVFENRTTFPASVHVSYAA